MNNQFIKNYNILKQINTKISMLKTKEVYSPVNRILELLQMRLESLVISVHINEHDYLLWKKNIARDLSSVSKEIDKDQKPALREIKALIADLYKIYDKAYIVTKPNSKDAEIDKGV